MPLPFTIAMVAAGAGVAAILAAKKRHSDAWFASGGVLPGPATAAQKAQANQGGTTVSPMTSGGVASYLVQRGNFVRGLDMTRRTINPPYRITPHWGIDIAAPAGTPVYAVKTGRIVHAGPRSGYGNAVGLQHAEGGQSCWYAHLSRINVRNGQSVIAGQQIGEVGNTTAGPDGRAPFTTSPHLHWEIHPRTVPAFGSARRLDPVVWLRQHGIMQSGGPV